MTGDLLASILPLLRLAVPIAGVLIVLILAVLPSNPTRPGTSAKPEGRDHHEDRRE